MHEKIGMIYFIGMLVAFFLVPLILRCSLLEAHPFQKEFYTRSLGRDGTIGLSSTTLVLALLWPLTLLITLAGLITGLYTRFSRKP